jgi:hypothetical protein
MKLHRVLMICAIALMAAALATGCVYTLTPEAEMPAEAEAEAPAAADWAAPEGALVAPMVDEVPTLDGIADDAAWADAVAISIDVEDGANMGESVVDVKSVYADDMVYFLVQWADPNQDFMRSPWQKQEDGSWARLTDPDDRGGDNNVYYEDKMAFIWPIAEGIRSFESKGCFTACHDGENEDVKPYGNKYTDEGMGDIWHWKSVRNVNQLDDQYLDSTQYSPETPGAGRHGDPKDGGGYVNNDNEDKTAPMWMGPEGYPVDGSPGYILDTEKLPFDDSLFVAGDMIGGVTTAPFEGDRGDLSAGYHWEDGMWTVEIGRKLETGSEYDVQYDDLSKPYNFGVAVFDNAQVRHAYQYKSNELVFQP